MELLQLLEAAARSGVLALFLALSAVGYQTRELRAVRAHCEAEERNLRDRIGRLEAALREVYAWASEHTGGRRRARPPSLAQLDVVEMEDEPD